MATFGVVVPFGLAWIIPAAKARARRIEREGMPADADLLGEVDQLRVRLEEMEERLEFSERMLANQADPHALRALEGPAQ
ncbi:MAG: hypothetical protein ACREL4_01270 [Gemmatimonadales bacterium]